ASAVLSTVLMVTTLPWSAGWRRVVGVGLASAVFAALLQLGAGRAGPSSAGPPSFSLDERRDLARLAARLADSGAHLYRAWWCPDGSAQRELFGPEGSVLLPYVEEGSAPVPSGVADYPTWEIDGKLYAGVRMPGELAEIAHLTH